MAEGALLHGETLEQPRGEVSALRSQCDVGGLRARLRPGAICLGLRQV